MLLTAPVAQTATADEPGALAQLKSPTAVSRWIPATVETDSESAGNALLYAQSAIDLDAPIDLYGFERKSPRRAFLQSLVVPGWGQYYNRSAWWKPVAFLGIEVAALYSRSNFQSSGNDQEVRYKDFADEHWSDTSYMLGLKEVYYPTNQHVDSLDRYMDTVSYAVEDTTEIPPILRYVSWSHHAFFKGDGAKVDEDEFYESIGKYHQFNFGWDDFPARDSADFPTGPEDSRNEYVSPNRSQYSDMRNDANREFKKASSMLTIVAGNHLLSAIEAAFGARRYNRSHSQFGAIEPKIRWVISPSTGKPMTRITLGYKF